MDAESAFPRLFTVIEANELLPVVRPLVERVLEDIRRLKSTSENVMRNNQLDPDAPDLMERLREDHEIAQLVERLKESVQEINGHGCICKGVEQGLVDFPCMIDAEVVFLCWQIGEAKVSHWHRIEDGFAGRKPLLDDQGGGPDSKTSYH